jgi:WD40 repeat protein
MLSHLHTFTGHQGAIYALAVNTIDHVLYSSGGDGYIVAWDLTDLAMPGKVIAQVEVQVFTLQYLDTDRLLVIGDIHGGLYFLPIDDLSAIKKWTIHRRSIYSIVRIDDRIASVGADGHLVLWSLQSRAPEITFDAGDAGLRSLIHVENSLYLGYTTGAVSQLDIASLSISHRWQAHDKTVFGMVESDDILFTSGRDARLKSWTRSGNLIREVNAHMYTINSLSHVHNSIISCSRDHKIRVWTYELDLLQSIDFVKGGHIRSVNCGIFSSELSLFISGGDDRSIRVWHYSTVIDP